jgi:hypothetical protein
MSRNNFNSLTSTLQNSVVSPVSTSRNIFESLTSTFSAFASANNIAADDEVNMESDEEFQCPPPLRQRLGAFRNDEEASQVYHDLSDIHCELGEEVVVDDEGEIEVCIEDSDSSVSDSSEELEVDSQAENETEICNGIKWSREPRHNVRLRRNIINERQRTLVNDTNPLAVFEKLFPEEVRRVILRCTNRKADALRRENPESYRGRTYDSFSFLELNAFLGFIIRAGADRDNMSALIDFYNANDSKPFFRACMSYNRVKFLLKCLRFDNFIDREERKKK